MIRIFRHTLRLIALAALTACSQTDDVQIRVSPKHLLIPWEEGSAATFSVTGNTAWSLSYESAGFTVAPDHGAIGETTVTVTARQSNDGIRRQKLGAITVRANGSDCSVEVVQRSSHAAQTMLLYMPGRDLIGYFEHNIEGIRKAVTAEVPADGRILVCYQPQSHGKAVMQEIYFDPNSRRCETQTLKEYDDFDAGSVACVRQMLADAGQLAPAQRYGLIIGCHGKAWVPASGGTIPYSLRSAAADDDVWRPIPGAKPTRSFGDTGYELDIPELAEALTSLDIRFDYLVFDDCFMANIETLYDMRRTTDYIIASPCEIMAAGFPYDRITPHLFTDGGASHDLEKVCLEFWNFYQNDWNTVAFNEQSGCISMAVTAKLDDLAQVMKRINEAGKQPFELSQLQYYKGGVTPLFYDLGHFVALSCGDPALADEFSARMDETFPAACRLHTPGFFSVYNNRLNPILHYSGVSVSEPSERYAAENRKTSWYRETH